MVTYQAFGPEAYIVLGILLVVQIALMIVALVKLVRTPPARLTLPLWAWILIIVLVNMIGPIIFLAAGTRPEPAAVEAGPATQDAAQRAVDVLYGDKR